MLMSVIYVVVYTKGLKRFGGIAIGGIVGLDIFFLAFISGASMNPARSLAPALVSGVLNNLWLYWSATFIGTSIVALCLEGCLYQKNNSCYYIRLNEKVMSRKFMTKFNCCYYEQGFKEGQHMISFYVNTDFMAKVLTGRGSQYIQECSLMGIKVSQSLSKTLLFNLRHHTWNIILAALDGVIHPGKGHFILTI